jgi:hypothetical protein
MTAVAAAMLVIVVLAAAVLGAVGAWHHLTTSRRARQRLRRWRYLSECRVLGWQAHVVHTVRVGRRAVAERLSRPIAPMRAIRPPAGH